MTVKSSFVPSGETASVSICVPRGRRVICCGASFCAPSVTSFIASVAATSGTNLPTFVRPLHLGIKQRHRPGFDLLQRDRVIRPPAVPTNRQLARLPFRIRGFLRDRRVVADQIPFLILGRKLKRRAG